jgi:hypothetical protein
MRIGEHLLVDFRVGSDYFPELLREMSRSVLCLNNHKVVSLEVDLEDKDKTHLALGWNHLNSVLHKDIFLGFLTGCLLGVRTDSLDYDLHFERFNSMLIGSVHQSEQHAELFTSTNLSKRGIVVESTFSVEAPVGNILSLFDFLSRNLISEFILG